MHMKAWAKSVPQGNISMKSQMEKEPYGTSHVMKNTEQKQSLSQTERKYAEYRLYNLPSQISQLTHNPFNYFYFLSPSNSFPQHPADKVYRIFDDQRFVE